MKKRSERPVMNAQVFMANEYVASSCGESESVYKFKCDAGGGQSGNVYRETNGVEGLQKSYGWNNGLIEPDTNLTSGLSSYHACGKTHEAPTDDDFLNGYFVPIGRGETVPVLIWTENNTNVHCTTNLDIESWEITRS